MVKSDWKSEHYGPRGRYVPFLWHAFFDGTWLCRCARSQRMKTRALSGWYSDE